MSTPITLEDLKRFRSIVETGTPLDKRTVLDIISHAGQLQEHFDSALEANQALVEQLAQADKNADAYQTLYEQRAESLQQAEAQVARVREQRDKWDDAGYRYWIVAPAAVIALDYSLDGESNE